MEMNLKWEIIIQFRFQMSWRINEWAMKWNEWMTNYRWGWSCACTAPGADPWFCRRWWKAPRTWSGWRCDSSRTRWAARAVRPRRSRESRAWSGRTPLAHPDRSPLPKTPIQTNTTPINSIQFNSIQSNQIINSI